MPLPHDHALALSQSKDYWVKKISSKEKGNGGNGARYLVLRAPGCKLPGRIVSEAHEWAVIDYNGDVTALKKNVCIRDFEPMGTPEFHTHYNHHKLFSLEPHIIYEFYKRRTVPQLTGKDQCMTLVDTGVDIGHPAFTDGSDKDERAKKTYLSHRKIKNYIAYGDESDEDDGHGTFMAGIVAGNTTCNTAKMNGFAPSSRVLVIDIQKSGETDYTWPANLSDMFYIPELLQCNVHLDPWTMEDKPLLTQMIDSIAFKYPSLLMIFPAEIGKDGYIKSPADAKNVLTVGPMKIQTASRGFTEQGIPVHIHIGDKMAIGYTTKDGAPLFAPTTKDAFLSNHIFQWEVDLCSLNSAESSECKAILMFSGEEAGKKYNIPVIRAPKRISEVLTHAVGVRISLSGMSDEKYMFTDNQNKDSPGYLTRNLFKIKPEVTAPQGPIIGPRANTHTCNSSSLTSKEGTSVSAAFVASQALLIQEYLAQQGMKAEGATLKALLINIAEFSTAKDMEAPDVRNGWGVPSISVLQDPSSKLHILSNIEMFDYSHTTYCFETRSTGWVHATLAWFDRPKDPSAFTDLTATVSLIITCNGQQFYTNSHTNDELTIDNFNTVRHVSFWVNEPSKIQITVVTGAFAVDAPINLSLVVRGPVLERISGDKCRRPESAPCIGKCEGRGTCVRGFCSCTSDRTGDTCSYRPKRMKPGNVMNGTLKRMEWQMGRFCPHDWNNESRINIDVSQIDKRKLGLHVSSGHTSPWWDTWFCSLDRCKAGTVTNTTMSFTYADLPFLSSRHCLNFGVFNAMNNMQEFKLTLNAENVELKDEEDM